MFISSHVFGYIPSQSIWQKATDPKDHFTCWSAVEYLGKKEKVKVQELFDCNITYPVFFRNVKIRFRTSFYLWKVK